MRATRVVGARQRLEVKTKEGQDVKIGEFIAVAKLEEVGDVGLSARSFGDSDGEGGRNIPVVGADHQLY